MSLNLTKGSIMILFLCFLKSVLVLMLQARGSMLMFVASFLTIMAIGGFPSFVEDMKVSCILCHQLRLPFDVPKFYFRALPVY